MRVNIKTNGPIKDQDIKALYLMESAMKISSDRMRKHNLKFIADKWKIKP